MNYRSLACTVALMICAKHAFCSANDWPQWRGPDRTGVSKETGLLQSWPEGGPKRLWVYDQGGSGYSGPAIVQGKLFTMELATARKSFSAWTRTPARNFGSHRLAAFVQTTAEMDRAGRRRWMAIVSMP